MLFWLLTSPLPAQENPEAPPSLSLEEIDHQLNNPLAKTWALVLQDNIGIQEGDAVDGTTSSNVLFFQPLLPVPVGENLIFSGRPVFPLRNVVTGTSFPRAEMPGWTRNRPEARTRKRSHTRMAQPGNYMVLANY